ncbi:MAG: hypothetical protein ACK4WH_12745 [Phycisphaerales bacterium]
MTNPPFRPPLAHSTDQTNPAAPERKACCGREGCCGRDAAKGRDQQTTNTPGINSVSNSPPAAAKSALGSNAA